MSDNFLDKNNANLTNLHSNTKTSIAAAAKLLVEHQHQQHHQSIISSISDDIRIQYDHMYATNHAINGDSNANGLLVTDTHTHALTQHPQPPTPTAPHQHPQTESEVNFIKDFLLIHLDLIQQQNDDIVNKENALILLQQENQQLREQIKSLEAQLVERTNACSVAASVQQARDARNEDMIIDSTTVNIEQPILPAAQATVEAIGGLEEEPATGRQEAPKALLSSFKLEARDEYLACDYSHSSYTIHSTGDDPMKNLKMSIRRKRLCSNSSALSNNGSTSDEKKCHRRESRKKRQRMVKHEDMLTHADDYVTQVGSDPMMDVVRRQELAEEVARAAISANLEVPRWRVKVYTSCYSLEGTENLDDEVFLRRHVRMENDEKRRKRWDVQRIREQRVIEKLKQRQEKIDANSKLETSEEADVLASLWPSLDDVKYIEKCDDLPVAAFGVPIPKIQPSVFSLPWLNNPNIKKTLRRSGTRRRRRSSKR